MNKKNINYLCILFCCLFLLGCNKTERVNSMGDRLQSMEGYITDIKSGKVLVVDSIPTNFSSSNGIDEFYNAIWFSHPPKNAKV